MKSVKINGIEKKVTDLNFTVRPTKQSDRDLWEQNTKLDMPPFMVPFPNGLDSVEFEPGVKFDTWTFYSLEELSKYLSDIHL